MNTKIPPEERKRRVCEAICGEVFGPCPKHKSMDNLTDGYIWHCITVKEDKVEVCGDITLEEVEYIKMVVKKLGFLKE